MTSGSRVASVVVQALAGGEVRLNDPRPVRDYVFVDDMVAAIVASLRIDLAVPMQVCNVGSGIGTSAGALAQKTLGIMARTVPVTRSDLHDRPGQIDIMETVADVSER